MRGILIGAAVMFASGAAFAQPTAGAKDDTTGLFCVYNAIKASGGVEAVGATFLDQEPFDDVQGVEWAGALQDQEDAVETCRETFDLSDGKALAANDMGALGSAVDYLGEELIAAGVSKRALGRVHGVYDGLEDAEADLLVSESWREDATFAAKIRKQLKTAGVPDKDETMEMAFSILELSALSDEVIFSFLTDDL